MRDITRQILSSPTRIDAPRFCGVFTLLPRSCIVLTAGLVLLAALALRAFGATPAGALIQNTAYASFDPGGGADTSASNTVSARVRAVFGFRLGPPGTTAAPAFNLSAAPGDTVYCRVTLTNLANAPDSASMSFANLPPATTAIISVVYFLDSNANGRFDAGEDDPAFLSLAMGSSTPVDVALVCPASTGNAYVALRATSAHDPNMLVKRDVALAPAFDQTVVHVTVGATPSLLYFGPRGNPRATPGGEGSPDDETRVVIGANDESVTLDGEIEMAGGADSVQIYLARSSSLPLGATLACTDTSGALFPSLGGGRFNVGLLAGGRTLPLRFVVSTPGTRLRVALASRPMFQCVAQSRTDSLRSESTRLNSSHSELSRMPSSA